jgi:hypothetical protein
MKVVALCNNVFLLVARSEERSSVLKVPVQVFGQELPVASG